MRCNRKSTYARVNSQHEKNNASSAVHKKIHLFRLRLIDFESHQVNFFFFSKTKTSIDLKMAKKPVKHVKSYNIARDRDYKISKPFHS